MIVGVLETTCNSDAHSYLKRLGVKPEERWTTGIISTHFQTDRPFQVVDSKFPTIQAYRDWAAELLSTFERESVPSSVSIIAESVRIFLALASET